MNGSLSPKDPGKFKRKGLNHILLGALILVLCAICLVIFFYRFPFTFDSAETRDGEGFAKSKAVYLEEMIIVDCYAVTEDEQDYFFLGMYYDKAGKACFFSVAPPNKKVQAEWLAYVEDESQMIGDLSVSAYLLLSKWEDASYLPSTDRGATHYASAVEYYAPLFREENITVHNTAAYTKMLCDKTGNPYVSYILTNIVQVIGSVAFLAIGIGLLWLGIHRRKEEAKRSDAVCAASGECSGDDCRCGGDAFAHAESEAPAQTQDDTPRQP